MKLTKFNLTQPALILKKGINKATGKQDKRLRVMRSELGFHKALKTLQLLRLFLTKHIMKTFSGVRQAIIR